MSALADPRISALQEQAGPSGELDLPVGDVVVEQVDAKTTLANRQIKLATRAGLLLQGRNSRISQRAHREPSSKLNVTSVPEFPRSSHRCV